MCASAGQGVVNVPHFKQPTALVACGHVRVLLCWFRQAMEQFMDVKPSPRMCYKGNYQFGRKHGMGKFSYPNGSVYHGQFMFDKRHGV